MTGRDPPPREPLREPLREACLREAAAIVDAEGVEALSLREVSRRLGVSHQAPYKHFRSRDHILAAIVERVFASFARHLEDRPRHDDPFADLGALGRAYLAYARDHPDAFRLMFATPLPDPSAHPEMMAEARRAFALLHDAVRSVADSSARADGQSVADPEPGGTGGAEGGDAVGALDALFVWATVHGLASLMQSRAFDTLGLDPATIAAAPEATLARIGAALSTPRGDRGS